MSSIFLSAVKILEHHPIEVSAPCRIDSGGTWDIKAMALPMERIRPVTINMALNLRTRVKLTPFKEGWVRISSEGFNEAQQFHYENLPFNSPFGLFFAAIAHFGYHGLKVHISSDSPVKSALGGSSTALTALIKALSVISVELDGKEMPGREILHLGYHLEDGINGGNCGMQDQAAAVYGGVNRWTWCFNNRKSPFKRESLLNTKGQKELSRRILVAFSGKSHVSARINRTWINDFLSGKTRNGWIKANDLVCRLGDAIKEQDWHRAAGILSEEMSIRREITPDALIPVTERLIDQAENTGCGARFAGAGGGGSVWALGGKERIKDLRDIWEMTLSPVRGARILDCTIDPVGVR